MKSEIQHLYPDCTHAQQLIQHRQEYAFYAQDYKPAKNARNRLESVATHRGPRYFMRS